MSTPDGQVHLTYNGEVYNYRELRRELEQKGYRFRTASDTEVILYAYEAWGRFCVERFEGMFAFAIWEAQARRLFVARDRLGIKPVYYASAGGRFAFASEVRTILGMGIAPPRIDPIALHEYLAYQSIPAPRTLIDGIRMLPPGTWMTVDASGAVEEHAYWDLIESASSEARGADRATILRRTGELLRESTELHLVSDVPVGVFLSGGIDSALVAEIGRAHV